MTLRLGRRQSITATAIGATGVTLTNSPAITQQRFEWRMVTAWPKGFPGLGTGIERLADNINAMSGGRLVIRVYAADELVPAFGVFDAVASGTVQMGGDGSIYNVGKSEAFAFFTTFPWGMTATEMDAWVHFGEGQALWDELYKPFGVRAFAAGNTGPNMFGWLKQELKTVEDLSGLKYRATGIQGRVLQKLGVVPVVLPAGEIFPALQSGAIDGVEWVGPYNDLILGIHQLCKYYYAHGYHEPSALGEVIINEEAWQSLPADLQQIIRVAAMIANRDSLAETNARSGPALRALVQEHGVTVKALPEDVILACAEASNDVLAEIYDNGDDLTRRIIKSFLAFRKGVIPWTRIGEQAFMNARRLPFEFGLKT